MNNLTSLNLKNAHLFILTMFHIDCLKPCHMEVLKSPLETTTWQWTKFFAKTLKFKDITCTTNDGQCHVAVCNLKNEYAIMYINQSFKDITQVHIRGKPIILKYQCQLCDKRQQV